MQIREGNIMLLLISLLEELGGKLCLSIFSWQMQVISSQSFYPQACVRELRYHWGDGEGKWVGKWAEKCFLERRELPCRWWGPDWKLDSSLGFQPVPGMPQHPAVGVHGDRWCTDSHVWMDLMILQVSSNRNDSILWFFALLLFSYWSESYIKCIL